MPVPASDAPGLPPGLLDDLRSLIETARREAAAAVNTGMTLMYWRVGRRARRDVLGDQRASYGERIVSTLSRQLTLEYGRSFSEKNLRHMMRFADAFPDEQIVSTLSRQLPWSHFLELIYLKDPLARDFYAQLAAMDRWPVRVLRERMGSMLYERTAVAKQPQAVIERELQAVREGGAPSTGLLFKDPYLLDFLGLHDRHLEKDIEDAILRELETFLLELGAGFSFVARQRRIQLDNDDFYIDLLFYNRRLRRLVAIELKLGDFRPEYKGQMELYLRWLARYDQEPGDAPPLGIILCTGKKADQIELLELDKSGIHVAEYLTVLPPREVFAARVQQALANARARLEANAPANPATDDINPEQAAAAPSTPRRRTARKPNPR
ncbi:PDDEXK nuclease domain-containing protein [Pseudaquabacterium pictum]|uniref:PDDEXK nuclease domain-containing protein n=1 Tax=Pseudaquabacterium pictum TaxID=2315236 RepID=UPI001D1328E7|nr:PDDEXK nuclease domain-containing protein [Rubrivivax pictus]